MLPFCSELPPPRVPCSDLLQAYVVASHLKGYPWKRPVVTNMELNGKIQYSLVVRQPQYAKRSAPGLAPCRMIPKKELSGSYNRRHQFSTWT